MLGRTLNILTLLLVLSCSDKKTSDNKTTTTSVNDKLDSTQLASLSDRISKLEQDTNFNAAILVLDSVMHSYTNHELYYLRGQMKARKFDTQGAIKDFDLAIYINPNYADAYYARGNQTALIESDIKTPQACEYFIKAKQLGCKWVTDETIKFCSTK